MQLHREDDPAGPRAPAAGARPARAGGPAAHRACPTRTCCGASRPFSDPVPVVITQTVPALSLEEQLEDRVRRLPAAEPGAPGHAPVLGRPLPARLGVPPPGHPAGQRRQSTAVWPRSSTSAWPGRPGPAPRGVGTREYLSPEQARGDDLTAAADVWGVAVTLYEVATGSSPLRPGERRGRACARPPRVPAAAAHRPPRCAACVAACHSPSPPLSTRHWRLRPPRAPPSRSCGPPPPRPWSSSRRSRRVTTGHRPGPRPGRALPAAGAAVPVLRQGSPGLPGPGAVFCLRVRRLQALPGRLAGPFSTPSRTSLSAAAGGLPRLPEIVVVARLASRGAPLT